MIGEYIGRIYDETKNRPLYIVREKYGLKHARKSRFFVINKWISFIKFALVGVCSGID